MPRTAATSFHAAPLRRRRAFIRTMLACAWLAVCVPTLALANGQTVENQVKAAFLYKFAGYVEWPSQSFDKPGSPFVIGIVDDDAFAQVLEQTIAGRGMNGRPVTVLRLRRGDVPKGLHILYVARTDGAALSDAISATKGQAVLTVTDSDQGLSAGSMISFVIENNKVRFDIAPEVAELSRLKISARLMSVARKVAGRASS